MKVFHREPKVPHRWQKYVVDHLTDINAVVAGRQKGKTEMATEIGFSIIESPEIQFPRWVMASDTIERMYGLYADRLNAYFRGNDHFNWTRETQKYFRIPRKEGDAITIEVHGSRQNFNSAKGRSNHYVLCDEYGLTGSMYAEEVLLPTISATNGIAFITGTVEDNWWYDFFFKAEKKMREGDPYWFAFYTKMYDEWCKKDFTDEWRDRVRSMFDLTNPKEKRIFDKEILCDWLAGSAGKILTRAYHVAYNLGHIDNFPYDPKYKVGISMDNGHLSVVWFWQLVKGVPILIDCIEYDEEGLEDIAEDVRKWYNDREAEVDLLIFPHTMAKRVQEAGMRSGADIFMKAFGEGNYVIVPRVGNVEVKISATRKLIASARFDFKSCSPGLRSIRNYKRKVVKSKGIISSVIDKQDSHGAEALGELALCMENNVFDNMNRVRSVKNNSSKSDEAVLDATLARLERKAGIRRYNKIDTSVLGGY